MAEASSRHGPKVWSSIASYSGTLLAPFFSMLLGVLRERSERIVKELELSHEVVGFLEGALPASPVNT